MDIERLAANAKTQEDYMGLISMKVLDMALDTLKETGAGLTGMMDAVPAPAASAVASSPLDPSSAVAYSGEMSADHIDVVV